MNHPVLGVIGGVGPLATAYFMQMIIEKTPATCDQDNIPMVVVNDPQIPDRTAHILDATKPDPLPEMQACAELLERAGADYLAIPCNTAHYFYDGVASQVGVPVLHMLRETAARARELAGPGARAGLLATDGTLAAGVFQRFLAEAGIEAVAPSPDEQRDVVMHLIYDCIKSGLPYDAAPLLDLAQRMHENGCDVVVFGCTELSVVYHDLAEPPAYLIDAMDVLADRCVNYYLEHR